MPSSFAILPGLRSAAINENTASSRFGGDFNTNHDQEMFAAEKTLEALIGAGYQNGFEELPLSQRVTHPGTHGFPDATFDYLFTRDLKASQPIVTPTTVSDHWPVTRTFRLR